VGLLTADRIHEEPDLGDTRILDRGDLDRDGAVLRRDGAGGGDTSVTCSACTFDRKILIVSEAELPLRPWPADDLNVTTVAGIRRKR